MARFPYYERNVIALGKRLAEASLDPQKRASLERNPKEELAAIGLPGETVGLFEFKVIHANPDQNHVVLPFRLNKTKLDQKDPLYLEGLGKLFSSRDKLHA